MKIRMIVTSMLTSALLLAVALQTSSQAQDAERNRGPQDGQRAGGEGDRGRGGDFQQRMAQRMKERLNATDEEWQVIQPRLTKVMTMQFRGGGPGGPGMGFLFRGGPGGGPGGPGGPGGDRGPGDRGRPDGERGDRGPGDRGPGEGDRGPRDTSEVGQKMRALNDTLEKDNPSPESVKKALEELRAARTKQEAELKKAREELREVLSLQQEAQLVLLGFLD